MFKYDRPGGWHNGEGGAHLSLQGVRDLQHNQLQVVINYDDDDGDDDEDNVDVNENYVFSKNCFFV